MKPNFNKGEWVYATEGYQELRNLGKILSSLWLEEWVFYVLFSDGSVKLYTEQALEKQKVEDHE